MNELLSVQWMSTVYVLGAVQSAFFAVVLVSRRWTSEAHRLLSGLMLTFSADLGMAAYHAMGYDVIVPHFIGFDYPLTLLYGPLFYLYVRRIRVRTSVRRIDYFHFAPFALFLVAMGPFYAQSGLEKLALVQGTMSGPVPRALTLGNHLKIGHALVYVGLTIQMLYRSSSNGSLLQEQTSGSTWIRNLAIGTLFLAGVAMGTYAVRLGRELPALGLPTNGIPDGITLLGTTLFVYAIGYLGLREPSVISGLHEGAPSKNGVKERPRTSSNAYEKSGMGEKQAGQYADDLVDLMEREALYRREDLTLQQLADALSITPHNLSEVLNAHLDQSFHEFVNHYRVEDVKRRLTELSCQHLTVLAIGFEAGFNSKSTFYSVFKKHTGMTPSQYQEQAAQPTA